MSDQAAAIQTMQRESSLDVDELNDLAEQEIRGYDGEGEKDDEDADLPPGRMHATRSATALRLKGNKSLPNLPTGDSSVGSAGSGGASGPHRRHKSSSNLDGTHSPRSKSPSLRGGTASTADGNSSISSLEDLVDSDILYDRAGLQDDVMSASSEGGGSSKRKSRDFVNLTPVNERLSEDTLEDVHAFSDVRVPSSNASRANSVNTEGDKNLALDPLEECLEEDDHDDDELDDDDDGSLDEPSESVDNMVPPVILTNIENLSLQATAQESVTGGGGESQSAPNN